MKDTNSRKRALEDLDPCVAYNIYLNSKGDNFKIMQFIDSFSNNLSLTKYVNIITKYARKNIKPNNWSIFFDSLDNLDIQNKEEIIELFNNLGASINDIKINLLNYILIYRPDIYFHRFLQTKLQQKIDIYMKYLDKIEGQKIYTNTISFSSQMIEMFIESPYSLKRFCYHHNTTITKFKEHITKVKQKLPSLYQKFVETLYLKETIKEQTIENDIYTLLNKMNDETYNFNVIDFFLSTVYSFEEIIQKGDEILSMNDKKLLRANLNDYRSIKKFNSREIDNIVVDKYIFNIDGNLIELSKEDKLYILGFLKENDIPISITTFKEAYIRYYKRNIIKNSK